MNRKNFIARLTKGSLATVLGGTVLKSSAKDKVEEENLEQVGFNHIKKMETTTATTVLHKADTRGHANHGWLDSKHTFSFANYYNPERVHFGMLRVLNDDTVAPGRGFGTHPHDNMEIISIPLSGDLEHKDSMGTKAVIKEGEIQVMSAGTGVYHSEYNANKDKEVKFLQIWVFPNAKNVTPRYDQIKIGDLVKTNEFSQILSPNQEDQGVWIHQDAWFNMGQFDQDTETKYQFNRNGNGVYAFVLEGEIEIDGQKLSTRDGFGVWDTDAIDVKAQKGAKVLLMEVPMN
ncbi:MAG: pirin family protein [Ekhidna sp.]|nr:pirin family protein [Ekhidna sp.]